MYLDQYNNNAYILTELSRYGMLEFVDIKSFKIYAIVIRQRFYETV